LEERDMLVTFLDGDENDIQIIIGSETGLAHMHDCSIIRTGYSLGGGRHGAVGVIGPKRMNYSQVVAVLAATAKNIQNVFNEINEINETGGENGRRN
jgi:heat-inducible transcriptional repressor